MIGFVIGTICLIGLAKVVRHRHGCGRWGRRPGWRGHGRGGGWGRVEYVLDAVRASPDQERAIREHMRDFRKRVEPLKDEAHRTREDLATAMRAESFDETVMGEMFARQDDALRDLRRELVGLLSHVHASLDEDQRRVLARILESGRARPFGGGPYRAHM